MEENKEKKKLVKYIFLILLTLSLFMYMSENTEAYYCANPLAELGTCENLTFNESFSLELCCPDSENYGEMKSYPKSKEDCKTDPTVFGDKCDLGCCLELQFMSCSSYTSRVFCNGVFSTRFSGSCTKKIEDKEYYVIGSCETGCCCKVNGFAIDTRGACQDGIFNPDINDIFRCASECSSIVCMDGCQLKKPFFCKDEKLYNDCTGGDGIAGNDNDCGCPSGQMCTDSGKCTALILPETYSTKDTCINHGFRWYEYEKRCVKDCAGCKTEVILEESVYIDPCKNVKCGENSACSIGQCVCNKGFSDDSCRLLDSDIDYDSSGCVQKDPCKTAGGVGKSFLWAILIFFGIFIVILYIKFRNREKPENPPNQEYYQQNNYQNYMR
jgi:hypothetical protein